MPKKVKIYPTLGAAALKAVKYPAIKVSTFLQTGYVKRQVEDGSWVGIHQAATMSGYPDVYCYLAHWICKSRNAKQDFQMNTASNQRPRMTLVPAALTLFLTAFLCGFTTSVQAHNHEPLDLDGLLKAFGWDFDTAEIKVEKLTDNFFVLFGIGGNIGVSVGENGTMIVDDQFPQMMPKIEEALAGLPGSQGKKVDFAINTHWHFDHAEGNLSLGPAGTWIVAQENSREMMQDDHVINLAVVKYLQKAYPDQALPVITYKDRMRFHFNGEQIDLLHFGPAHTTGDTAVYFRGTNAVHFGDVFNRGYPFIDADNGGDIDGMAAFCESVLQVIEKDTRVIPGHGEVGTYNDLAAYISMLKTISLRIGGMISDGLTVEQVAAAKPTAQYDKVYGDPTGFVNRVYASLIKKKP